MNSYNYSYNVLINRLEAFAAGHLLIKRFTHGQIDLADMDQDEQYPFMHVVPNNIKPVDGGMQFDFQILFADIPRDKEVKAEYQREVISDCVRLAQDLIAEVKNGLSLFGFDVQLVTPPVIEPFMEEYKNTLTGVTFSLQLEVPWDWSACDIPAIWAVGGSSTGGSGSPIGIVLRTNGVDNAVQNILDLVAGTNITITDNGDGSVTFDAAGGGGGGAPYVSTEFNANHATALGNQYVIGDRVWYNGSVYACIANNDGINPTNPTYWTLQAVGYRLRQNPVDWNASSGDYQILNKPTLATVATSGDYNDLINTPSPQGLQSVINTDNDLTNNNIIEGNATNLTFQNNVQFKILPDPSIGFFEVFVGKFPPNESKLLVDPLNAYLYTKGATTQQFKTDSTKLYIQTPAVSAGTASVGQVLTLANASTGAVEYTTISAGSGTVTSVGLTMPAPVNPAFTVSGSPVTTSGTLAVSANGTASQYVDGTGALQSFPALSGFVPYTGATQDVDLDANKLSAESIYIEGTNGAGHLHLKHQNADATATAQSTALWADKNGDIKWKNDGNYKTTLKSSSNTADRIYTFPNETAELMPRNAAITPATKTKITYDADGLVTAGADIVASDISNSTTVGQNLVTLPNPSAIRYLRVNADNSVSALTATQLRESLGIYRVTLGSDVSITALNTTLADVTGFSFPITSGKKYRFKIYFIITTTANNTGLRIGLNANVGVAAVHYRTEQNSGVTTSNFIFYANALNQVSTNTAATLSNYMNYLEGYIDANATGTAIARFSKAQANAGTLTVKAGSFIEYEEF
jgi:hypothetical protein